MGHILERQETVVNPELFFQFRHLARLEMQKYQAVRQEMALIKDEHTAQWGVYAGSKLRDSYKYQDLAADRKKYQEAAMMYAEMANLYR